MTTSPAELDRLMRTPLVAKALAEQEANDTARRQAAIERLKRELTDKERAHGGRMAELTAQIDRTQQEYDQKYNAYAEVTNRLSALRRQRLGESNSFDAVRAEIEAKIKAIQEGREEP